MNTTLFLNKSVSIRNETELNKWIGLNGKDNDLSYETGQIRIFKLKHKQTSERY